MSITVKQIIKNNVTADSLTEIDSYISTISKSDKISISKLSSGKYFAQIEDKFNEDDLKPSEPNLQDKEITENGTYTADNGYDGLNEIIVNVPETVREVEIPVEVEKIVEVPANPNLKDETFTENGEYTVSEEYDGYGTITVNVPETIREVEVPVEVPVQPKLQEKTITENGLFNPDEGYDGFSSVEVNIPDPELEDIEITQNGSYISEKYGFNNVIVDIPSDLNNQSSLTITENGTYTADEGYTGLDEVIVNVPEVIKEVPVEVIKEVEVPAQPVLQNKEITENGTYTAESNYDGLGEVTVNVPGPNLTTISISSNGTYNPVNQYGSGTDIDGFNEIVVNVPTTVRLKNTYFTENGTYTPGNGYDGFGSITVNVPEAPFFEPNTTSIIYLGQYSSNNSGSGLFIQSPDNAIDFDDNNLIISGPRRKGAFFEGQVEPLCLSFNELDYINVYDNPIIESIGIPKVKQLYESDMSLPSADGGPAGLFGSKIIKIGHSKNKETLRDRVLSLIENPDYSNGIPNKFLINYYSGDNDEYLTLNLISEDFYLGLTSNNLFWDEDTLYYIEDESPKARPLISNIIVNFILEYGDYALVNCIDENNISKYYIVTNDGQIKEQFVSNDIYIGFCTLSNNSYLLLKQSILFNKPEIVIIQNSNLTQTGVKLDNITYGVEPLLCSYLMNDTIDMVLIQDGADCGTYIFTPYNLSLNSMPSFGTMRVKGCRLLGPIKPTETNGLFYIGSENNSMYQIKMITNS